MFVRPPRGTTWKSEMSTEAINSGAARSTGLDHESARAGNAASETGSSGFETSGAETSQRADAPLTRYWWGPPPRDPEVGGLVVTGVFDVLHVGHVRFLTWAAARGRPLWVGLEDDERVRAMKGSHRPINSLSARAEVITSLRSVSAAFVICGPFDASASHHYVELLASMNPAALAFTEGDPYAEAKRAGAVALNADVWEFPFQVGHSSSAVIERLQSERGQHIDE